LHERESPQHHDTASDATKRAKLIAHDVEVLNHQASTFVAVVDGCNTTSPAQRFLFATKLNPSHQLLIVYPTNFPNVAPEVHRVASSHANKIFVDPVSLSLFSWRVGLGIAYCSADLLAIIHTQFPQTIVRRVTPPSLTLPSQSLPSTTTNNTNQLTRVDTLPNSYFTIATSLVIGGISGAITSGAAVYVYKFVSKVLLEN